MDDGVAKRGAMVGRAWVIFGFGLFLVPYGGGPFGFISGPSQHAMGWEPLLLVQIVFFLFVVFGCVGMRLVARRGKNVPQGIIGAVGYVAAALLGLVMQPMLDGMPAQNAIIACTVLSAVAGIFFTPPFIWFNAKTCG